MTSAQVGELEICYETEGNRKDAPLLLIAGLGMQLVGWGDDFLERLAGAGFFVIAYDNRDVGLSTHLSTCGLPDLLALFGPGQVKVAYRLKEMADDAAGLLDQLGIASAHVLGVSMGGMIAQELVISHPDKVRSLVSVMSTTGAPDVGHPGPEAASELLRPAPKDRDEAVEFALKALAVIGSPGFPTDAERERRMAAQAYDRSHDPGGTARQLAAILSSPDRTAGLGTVCVPALVIHGAADPLVTPSGGRATAAALPSAKLMMIEGMGHSIPVELWDEIVTAIADNARAGDAVAQRKGLESRLAEGPVKGFGR
ncbi:MAG: alpha/beta fold hydrolase [Acidimicrobiales bacterium]